MIFTKLIPEAAQPTFYQEVYILTWVWVQGTPKAGKNLHFLHVFAWFWCKNNEKWGENKRFLSLSKMLINTKILVHPTKLVKTHFRIHKSQKMFFSGNKTLDQRLGGNSKKYICFFFIFPLFKLSAQKTLKNRFHYCWSAQHPKVWFK